MPPVAKKLSITLPPEMAEMLHAKVRSGGFGSVSEVIRTALRVMMEKERLLQSLDASVSRGLADVGAGRVTSLARARPRLIEPVGKVVRARRK